MQTEFPTPKYFICSLTIQAAKEMVAFYNRVLAPLGLTAQQMMALGVLWREEDLSLGEFARRAGIGKAAGVTMITRLENMGLVIRMPHPRDARLNVLRLTPKARELAPEVAGKVKELERNVESALGPVKMKILIEGLSAIRDLGL